MSTGRKVITWRIKVVCRATSHPTREVIVDRMDVKTPHPADRAGSERVDRSLDAELLDDRVGRPMTLAEIRAESDPGHFDRVRHRRSMRCELCGDHVEMRYETLLLVADDLRLAERSKVTLREVAVIVEEHARRGAL